jgi:hypothetical protein
LTPARRRFISSKRHDDFDADCGDNGNPSDTTEIVDLGAEEVVDVSPFLRVPKRRDPG